MVTPESTTSCTPIRRPRCSSPTPRRGSPSSPPRLRPSWAKLSRRDSGRLLRSRAATPRRFPATAVLFSGAPGDEQDTPGGAHLTVEDTIAQCLLDRGERSVTGLLIGLSERLADTADAHAGHGDLGDPVLADHNVIGMRLNGDGTKPASVDPFPDPPPTAHQNPPRPT